MKRKALLLLSFILLSLMAYPLVQCKIPPEKEMAAYLLVYFKDSDHSLHMAVSTDGYSFIDVNNGLPVIAGDTIAQQKGIRDPHIMRGPDNMFYLVMTDLHIYARRDGLRATEWERPAEEYGWGNNRGFVLMKSSDLIHWKRTNVNIDESFTGYDSIGCAWAPQTIWDEKLNKPMIYFTMRFKKEKDRLYYVYANSDFNRLESEPKLLFEYPIDVPCIDGDIVKVGSKYHLSYVPHDGTPGIKQAESDYINRDYHYMPEWVDSEEVKVEAPNVWKRIGEDKWVLMYDIYGIKPNNFGFRETSDFKNFTDLGRFNEGVMKAVNFDMPKHGAVIHLTKKEAERLCQHWKLKNNKSLEASNYPKVILPGDYADPTILRDGKDFYMTHSPFVYAPGFLIWHSTDLVNWKPIVRTMTRIKGSAYAPDLIKYKDRYYIYYPSNGTNWVIWADNIMGPWSDPVDLKVGLIDPGHIAGEDGKRYLHLSKGMMVELTDDGLATVGEPFKTYDGWQYPKEWDVECFCLESPKLTFKDGYYYLTSAEGGTAGPATSHMVVSARSRSPKGPWENSPYNPIVHTYSEREQWWSKGHGSLVDDVNGNWWIVYHAYEKDMHTLGRQTLIDPVEWTSDGWFKLDANRAPLQKDSDLHEMNLSDDFSSKKLGVQWTTWGKYNEQDFIIENNELSIKGKGSSPKDGRLLLVTVPDRTYEIQTEVYLKDGGAGGLVLFYRESVFAGITSDGGTFTIYKNADEKEEIPNELGKHFFLKIINSRNSCKIQISGDSKEWKTIRDNLDVSHMHHNNYRGFYALRAGLVAIGDTNVYFSDFQYHNGVLAPKPVFRDPVYDGAADPVVIWNPFQKKWWMYYTNRRATETHLPGVSWVFKTPIGIAESMDGANWTYAGTANFPDLPAEAGGQDATLWAPDIVYGDDGKWHMYLSIQAGVAERWGKVPGFIAHLTSGNMRDWKYERRFDLPIGSYDADVIKMPDNMWRMYYKDPTNGASTFYYLESKDLYEWSQPQRVMSYKSEGPIVFNWKGFYWMILCDGKGFSTFRSKDTLEWNLQPGGSLMPDGAGTGVDDVTNALHGEILISNNRAYLYYFTHPGRLGEAKHKDTYEQRRSSIQVVELQLKNGWLKADRNVPTYLNLYPLE